METVARGRGERRLTLQLIVGVVLLAAGVVFTLENLDLLDLRWLQPFWPVIIIAAGLIKLVQARSFGAFGSALVWCALGVAFLLRNLGVLQFTVTDLLPLVLAFIGIQILAKALRGPSAEKTYDSDATLSIFTMMGAMQRASNARGFRRADIVAVMGGCGLDLRPATIDPGGAVIDIFTIWGGIEIRVPDTWSVTLEGVPFMGGFEDKTRQPGDPSAPRLLVRGVALMGGVEVKN